MWTHPARVMAAGPGTGDGYLVRALRYTKRELVLAGALVVAVAVLAGLVLFRSPTGQTGPPAQVAGAHPSAAAPRSPSRPATPTVSPPRVLRTEYAVRGRWAGGFNAELVITNLGSEPVEGWTVRLRLPPDVKIGGGWAADISQAAGAVTLRSQPWNTYVAPGAAVHLGFAATGTAAQPSSCTVNGTPC